MITVIVSFTPDWIVCYLTTEIHRISITSGSALMVFASSNHVKTLPRSCLPYGQSTNYTHFLLMAAMIDLNAAVVVF